MNHAVLIFNSGIGCVTSVRTENLPKAMSDGQESTHPQKFSKCSWTHDRNLQKIELIKQIKRYN